MAWMSIMGMYEYDPTIFDGFRVPDGLDRDNTINNILLNCAELEIIYSNSDIMKMAIGIWSDSNQYTWNKLYQTTVVEYNPIWNVDADIEEISAGERTKTGSGSDNRTVNLKDKRTVDLHDNETINTHDNETVNLTDTKSVQGFNSGSWADAEKNVKSGTDNVAHSGTDNVAHTGTETIDHTGTDNRSLSNSENESSNGSVITRRTGNIGVTTTQQMLEQERAIAEFNLIEYITKSFKNRFCLMIY